MIKINDGTHIKNVTCYGRCSQRNLPEEYQEIEYLQSDGSCYIDTLRVPNNNDIFEQKFQVLFTSSFVVWYGSMPSSSKITPRISLGISGGFFTGTNNTITVSSADTNPHSIRYQSTSNTTCEYTIDGVEHTYTLNNFLNPQITLTSYLFARHGDNGIQVSDGHGTKIWYHREYLADGTLTLNLIPARRKSDQTLGMYDTVSGRFLTNSGTGVFTAGPVAYPSLEKPMDLVCDAGVLRVNTGGELYTTGTPEVLMDNLGNTYTPPMLLSVGNFKDTWDIAGGVVTRKVGVWVLKGNEAWTYQSLSGGIARIRCTPTYKIGSDDIAYCTHGTITDLSRRVTARDPGTWQVGNLLGTPYIGFKCYESDFQDAQGWKTYLSSQYAAGTPVVIVYPLAVPTTENVEAQEIHGSTISGDIDFVVDRLFTVRDRYIKDKEVKRVYNGRNLVYLRHRNEEPFVRRRTSGGELTEDVRLQGEIIGITGGTAKWNQLIQNGDFSNGTTGWNVRSGTISASNGILTFTGDTNTSTTKGVNTPMTLTINHKYLFRFEIKTDLEGGSGIAVCPNYASTLNFWYGIAMSTTFEKKSFIGNNINSTGRYSMSFRWVNSGNEGGSYFLKNVNVIDLTAIFGAGNEPSTPEEFETWLDENVGLRDYYPEDPGSLVPVKEVKLESAGFNQWDEEWETGYYNTDGQKQNSTNYIRSKNFIPVLPNTQYCFSVLTPNYFTVCEYDAGFNLVNRLNDVNNISAHLYTTTANTRYVTLTIGSSEKPISTYNHDICINLSDPVKNGTYEPSEHTQLSIPITSLTGKLGGEGESIVVCSDGLKRVGDVYDEIKMEGGVTKLIKRIGSVDLGTLNWWLDARYTNNQFYASIRNYSRTLKIVCYNYATAAAPGWKQNVDKTITTAVTTSHVIVVDSAYSDAATFKTAMNGVILYYELAEPQEYVLDNFEYQYLTSSDGTEFLEATSEVSLYPKLLTEYRLR